MRNLNTVQANLDAIDKQIINQFQDGIPIISSPYAFMANKVGINESQLISRLQKLLDSGVLTRFGPLYDTKKMGGTFSLCAMQVPTESFEPVSAIVNQFEQVAHNYERDHPLNMWFVIAVDDRKALSIVISDIEKATGLQVYNFPKQTEFNIHLRLHAE